MATYIGPYEEDFGKVRQSAKFSVYLISDKYGKIFTSFSTDSKYLPAIFLEKTEPYLKQPTCKLAVKPRYAKLWIDNETYLYVPIPFRASSSNFNQFFITVAFNFSITTIGYEGEKVDSDWIALYANQ